MRFRVLRGEESLDLTGALGVTERIAMRIDADPGASPRAVKVRDGLLHGKK